jgi:hypothetical protein
MDSIREGCSTRYRADSTQGQEGDALYARYQESELRDRWWVSQWLATGTAAGAEDLG